MENETGTNPEASSSAEQIVEAMLSRTDEPEQIEEAHEAGNQSAESPDDETKPDDSPDAKAEKDGTKPSGQKTEEKSTFELPKQQSADYPKDALAHYAKRLGTTLEESEKNPALRKAIKEAIDKDIYIEQLKSQAEKPAEALKTEEKPAEKAPEAKTEPAKRTTAEHLESLGKDAETLNDPEVSAAFKSELWKALAGVDINDPEVEKSLKERGIDTNAAVNTLTKFGLNLTRTVVAQALTEEREKMNEQIDKVYPGFSTMYINVVRSNAWEAVVDSNEAYKALPAYGSKEFQTSIEQVLKDNPWVDQMVIPGASPQDLTQKKYEVAARIMSGQTVKPADLAQAAEKGKQQGAEAQRIAARGKLDSGRTKGTITADKSGDSDIVNAYYGRNPRL